MRKQYLRTKQAQEVKKEVRYHSVSEGHRKCLKINLEKAALLI